MNTNLIVIKTKHQKSKVKVKSKICAITKIQKLKAKYGIFA
jgi:hypothetical protein